MNGGTLRLLRLLGLGVALFFTVPGVLNPQQWTFLNNVNLIFHEAGHAILTLAGETIMLLGGSFFQLLIPAGCAAAFWVRGDRYAAGLMLLWLAQSLANVSVYVADAPTRNLDLITGDPDTHDWWQLLGMWGKLGSAVTYGRVLHVMSLVLLAAGLMVALWDQVGPTEPTPQR